MDRKKKFTLSIAVVGILLVIAGMSLGWPFVAAVSQPGVYHIQTAEAWDQLCVMYVLGILVGMPGAYMVLWALGKFQRHPS